MTNDERQPQMPRNNAHPVMDESGDNPFGAPDAAPTIAPLTDADVFGPGRKLSPVPDRIDPAEKFEEMIEDAVTTVIEDDGDAEEPEVLDAAAGPQVGVEIIEDEIDAIEPTPGWGSKNIEEVLDNFHGMRLEVRVPTVAALTGVSFTGSSKLPPERQQALYVAFFQMHMSANSWFGLNMRMMNPERGLTLDVFKELSVALADMRAKRETENRK